MPPHRTSIPIADLLCEPPHAQVFKPNPQPHQLHTSLGFHHASRPEARRPPVVDRPRWQEILPGRQFHPILGDPLFQPIKDPYFPLPYAPPIDSHPLGKLESSLTAPAPVPRQQRRTQRKMMSWEATKMLRAWMKEHYSSPYPTNEEKEELAKKAGVSKRIIDTWFNNARKRYCARPGNRSPELKTLMPKFNSTSPSNSDADTLSATEKSL